MGYIVAFTLVVVNLLGTVIRNHSKLLIFLSIILMWILFGWNTDNPDYINYLSWYNEIQINQFIDGKDLGYKLLMYISNILGLDYQAFIIIVSIIGFLLINSTIKKFSVNSNFVYLLYLFFPFFLDVVQTRNFLMMAIIIYSIRFLLDYDKYSIIKYILYNLLAISIHSSAVLYLPLILINNKNKHIFFRIILIFNFLFLIIVFLNGNQIPFVKQFVGLFTDDVQILSTFEIKTDFGFIISWGLYFLIFLIIAFSRSKVLKYQQGLELIEIKFVNLIYWVTIIGFLWFPFYMVSIEFTRLFRNLFLLFYIVFTITNKALSRSRIESFVLYNFLIIGFTVFFFIYQLYIPHYNRVILPILENNVFW